MVAAAGERCRSRHPGSPCHLATCLLPPHCSQGSAWVRVAAVRFVELLVRLYTGDTVPAAPAPGAPEPQRLPADHALLGSAEMAREADAKVGDAGHALTQSHPLPLPSHFPT